MFLMMILVLVGSLAVTIITASMVSDQLISKTLTQFLCGIWDQGLNIRRISLAGLDQKNLSYSPLLQQVLPQIQHALVEELDHQVEEVYPTHLKLSLVRIQDVD
ncbi:hypothetical protein BDV12DRAFT_205374 [Aspergillus spectabilis]